MYYLRVRKKYVDLIKSERKSEDGRERERAYYYLRVRKK